MRVSRIVSVGVLFALAGLAAGAGGPAAGPPVIFAPPLSPRIVQYALRAELEPKDHLIRASETIRWKNTTGDTVGEALFHLYLNAFANNQSVFMKESGGRLRGDRFNQKDWGYCRVTAIAQERPSGGPAPLTMTFPGEDRTVLKVLLAEPVPPGGEAVFSISFEDKLPRVFARAGYAGDFNLAGQWFPKLGVYQEGRGWNCHAYHANSEFFADFGVYDVALTVPYDFVVGASGVQWREVRQGAKKTLDLHAEDVHDFAWVAQPGVLDETQVWEGVKIRVLCQPGNRRDLPRYFAATRRSLESFTALLSKYPYPQITVVDPPANGPGAGGMEYPMFITGMATPFLPASMHMVEMVTVHEFGHEYWYGMSANNEFEEAWLDEGINSYYESRVLDGWLGADRSMMDGFLGLNAGDVPFQRAQYISVPDMDPVVQRAWGYYTNGAYAAMSYSKPTLLLMTLEGYLGREKMDRAMRAFFDRVKFTHTTTGDFVRILSEEAGEDLSPLLGPMLFGTGTVDFKVARVQNRVPDPPAGFDLAVDPPRPYSDATGAKASKAKGKDGGAGKGEKLRYAPEVTIQRKGELVVPVEVLVTFADGTAKRERWDGRGRYVTYRYDGPKVVQVLVDPDGKVPLDLERLNNGWQAKEDGAAAGALGAKARALFQAAFALVAELL